MTLQLWLTAAVAIVGNVTVVANVMLAGRNAAQLALRLRDVDRNDMRYKAFEEASHQFLIAARLLRSPAEAIAPDETTAALSDLRRAVARIELYRSELAQGPVIDALEALELLVRVRSSGAWSASVSDAETACDNALSAARSVLTAHLVDPAH